MSPSTPQVNILLVDDQEDILLAHRSFLESLNQHIVLASSGEAALECVRELDFAVIVLDVYMKPGLDGFQTALKIRELERSSATPIIFVTGMERSRVCIEDVYGAGAVDILHKPVDISVFRSKVRVFVELAQKKDEIKHQSELLQQASRREHSRDLAHQKQLFEAQKIKAVGVLAAGVAHHFNNLLQIMLGNSAIASRIVPSDSPAQRALSSITNAGRRASDLVRRMTLIGKPGPDVRNALSVNESVLEAIAAVKPTIPANVRITTALGTETGRWNLSPSDFEQVFLVLALNARDAMPDGGVLSVETSTEVPVCCRFAEPFGAKSGMSCVTVSDTGVGMDAGIRAHLFEPFFTTKDPDRGVGLGLYTAYAIVERAGGIIQVESKPNEGSKVHICLPRMDVEQEPFLSPQPVVAPQSGIVQVGQGRTVLVVEDEEEVRNLVVKILELDGYRTLMASSAEEALEKYQDAFRSIDLLLTDVVLPGKSGLVLARKCREICPDLKVVLMTAHTEVIDQRRGSVAEHERILRKPFEIATFRLTLQQALME